MDLCQFDLNNHLLSRDKPLCINELKEILFQLNNIFKKLNEVNQMNLINIEISNILLNLNEINKISIKLSYLNISKFTEESEITANLAKKIFLITPPEILKGESYNNKSDIWSLGIIIYYMLNKKYPYEGKNEIKLLQNIISNQNIELNKDEELNNLLKRMLKVNINERISWKDYFNHSFFKQKLGKIKENYIICEYDIKKEELNKPIQILNCLNEEGKKN